VLEHCLAADTPNDAAVIAKLIADIDNVDLTKADEVCALKKNWAALGADISSFDIVIVEPTSKMGCQPFGDGHATKAHRLPACGWMKFMLNVVETAAAG